jgi:AcrR family transcriptional regulator
MSDEDQFTPEERRYIDGQWAKLAADPGVAEWVEGQKSARVRAGETKKRRTRAKLIQAADAVMAERGSLATVEEIAEDAGVSTPTFYTFYKSRNALCVDAFLELVVGPLEELHTLSRSLLETLEALQKLCAKRSDLLRAALIGRLEATEGSDFVDRVADLLVDEQVAREGKPPSQWTAVKMAALRMLDGIAMRDNQLNTITLARVTVAGAKGEANIRLT